MNAGLLNVIWKTPEEVDADRLANDYERIDRGECVASPKCALAGAAFSCGSKIEPLLPWEESEFSWMPS